MVNAWENVTLIAAEFLRHLETALVITSLAGKDITSEFNLQPNGYKVGDSIRVKTNPEYVTTEFSSTITKQAIRSSHRTITIEKHLDISVSVGAKEKRLNMQDFTNEVIIPAAYQMAEDADKYVGTKILNARGLYDSADLFASAADMASARSAANLQRLQPGGRFCLVNDTIESKLLGASYFNTFNTRGPDGQSVFRTGSMGPAMGMTFFASLNFPTWSHAVGDGVSQTDNGSGGNTNNQIGATVLTIDALTLAEAIPAGAFIKVAGCKRYFRCKTLSNAGANTTAVPLVDPIDEYVADNAAVTLVGSGTLAAMGAIFDSASLGVAMPMLDPPSDKPSSVVSNNGYSLRVVQGYDMDTKTEIMSIDMLIGAEAYDGRRITLLTDH